MNKMLLNIIVLLFILQSVQLTAQPKSSLFTSDSLLVFAPFKDHSGFKGKWNITTDIPRLFSAYMKERFRIGVVTPVSVASYFRSQNIDSTRFHETMILQQCAEFFNVRYLVVAKILDFSISRFMVSEVQLAGYEAFSAEVKINFTLYDAARAGKPGVNPVVYEGEAEGMVKDRGLGITLFGKQTDRTNEFYSLDELAFGSEQFNKTIIGEALLKCADDLGTKLERAIPTLVSKSVVLSSSVVIDTTSADSSIVLKRQLVNGEIVLVDGNEVFINLGSQDGVRIGDLLPVIIEGTTLKDPKTGDVLGTKDDTIGEIQIIEIRAEHLALAVIMSGKDNIAPKQRVRKVLIR
jgi:hypothetical protein